MIKIAHRGNFNGANYEMENNPEYLLEAINKGFHIEADIWFNNKFYLGHDEPKYLIDLSFIISDDKQYSQFSFLLHLGKHKFI